MNVIRPRLRIEDDGYSFGFPQGSPGDVYGKVIGRGRMLTRGRYRKDEPVVAWTQIRRIPDVGADLSGISGGPWVDAAGDVIGVHVAGSPRRGRSYSTAPRTLLTAIRQSGVRAGKDPRSHPPKDIDPPALRAVRGIPEARTDRYKSGVPGRREVAPPNAAIRLTGETNSQFARQRPHNPAAVPRTNRCRAHWLGLFPDEFADRVQRIVIERFANEIGQPIHRLRIGIYRRQRDTKIGNFPVILSQAHGTACERKVDGSADTGFFAGETAPGPAFGSRMETSSSSCSRVG